VTDLELVVVGDEQELAAVVAERLARAAREGGNVVLTGGKTPEMAYEEAAMREGDWSKVDVWWGDERCVPPDDKESNYALAKRSLLDRLERGPRSVHRIKGELGKEAAAAEYERELDDTQLELLLLGMGPDGHIASLFPDAPTLRQRKKVLPAEAGLEPFIDRVTLSVPALESAREILFLVAGESKADAAAKACAGRQNRCNPGSRCCSQAPGLTEASLYVEVLRGSAGNADTRQARTAEGPRPSAPGSGLGDARPGRRVATHEPGAGTAARG
jgi:6-phosphogluconolactonase